MPYDIKLDGETKKTVLKCRFTKCEYKSDKNSNFKRHFETMHQTLDPPIHCCDISFVTKGEFRHHTKTAHSEGHRCPVCLKLFSRKALLERHMSIHTGNKPFKCSECDYASANKANVSRHLSIHVHTGAKIINPEEDSLFKNCHPSRQDHSHSDSFYSHSGTSGTSGSSISTSTSRSTSRSTSASTSAASSPVEILDISDTFPTPPPQKRKSSITHSIDAILSKPYINKPSLTIRQRHWQDSQNFRNFQNYQNLQNYHPKPEYFLPPPPPISHQEERRKLEHNILKDWSHTSSKSVGQEACNSSSPQSQYCTFQDFQQQTSHFLPAPTPAVFDICNYNQTLYYINISNEGTISNLGVQQTPLASCQSVPQDYSSCSSTKTTRNQDTRLDPVPDFLYKNYNSPRAVNLDGNKGIQSKLNEASLKCEKGLCVGKSGGVIDTSVSNSNRGGSTSLGKKGAKKRVSDSDLEFMNGVRLTTLKCIKPPLTPPLTSTPVPPRPKSINTNRPVPQIGQFELDSSLSQSIENMNGNLRETDADDSFDKEGIFYLPKKLRLSKKFVCGNVL